MEDVRVRFISSSIVQATNHQELSRIELTPWDLRLLPLGHIKTGLLFPKPKPLQEKETENTLKASLSHFPPLAGRLATTEREDNTISYFIDCNHTGALFIHAIADGVSISDVIQPVYVPQIVYSFFPLNGLKNFEGVSDPLLGIQVTDFVDGIFIGCTMNHAVVDGASFWHFFNSWSEISSGSIHLSKPPSFQRWFPDGIHLPIRIPKSQLEEGQECISPPNLQERVFHFTSENIAKLKAKANAEMGTNNISSLQALQAHIWQSIIRNKDFVGDSEKETNYHIVIDDRHRLQELPENYFGNAILGVVVSMKEKELLKEGIGNVVWEINKMIATMTVESLKKFLESLPTSPKLATMALTNNTLLTSSSPRFNIYGNDFGWGKPIAVRSGSANKFEGIEFFCGIDEGSIDIELYLSVETLEAMVKDEEFMDTVTQQPDKSPNLFSP